MTTYAQELLGDARILEAPRGPQDFMSDFPTGSLTGYQLIYAFTLEVLLKAAILWHDEDEAAKQTRGHASAEMWLELPADARNEIISYAADHGRQHQIRLHGGLDDPGKLFQDWGLVFTGMRYRYEIFDDKSESKEADRALREQQLHESGQYDPELADWRTWDGERDCMIEAFLRYLNAPERLNMTYRNERVR